MSTRTTPQQHLPGDGLRTALGIGGLIAIVLGLLIVFFPAASGAVTMQIVAALAAAYALVVGVVYLGTAVFARTIRGWARTGRVVLGLLYIIGGVVMLVNLGATAAILAIFLSVTVGALWVFEGALAFATLKQSPSRAWSIVHGVASVLAGAVLILTPLLAAVTLWLLLGVSMLVLGVVQAVRAFGMKPAV
ncbi:HdeD family acid-resistance protein [Leucobacter chromiiresistens]